MAIRIESLSLTDAGSIVTPPQSAMYFFSTDDRSSDMRANFLCEMVTIYGGSSRSVAPMPSLLMQLPDSAAIDSAEDPPDLISNWSASLQTTLDRPPSTLPDRLAIGGVMFCAAFATWAAVGQIDEVGQAQGRLVPQGDAFKVNPVVAGKVAHVYVKEGQSVKAGQIIARLDDEVARNRVEWSKQETVNYQKELLQIDALIQKTKLEAQNQRAIASAEISAQEAQLSEAQAKIESQKLAIMQAMDRATTGETLLQQLQADDSLYQDRLARFESLVNEGALARDQLFQVQQQLADRQRSITQQQGDIQQAMGESQRLRSDLQQRFAEFRQLQANLAQKYAEATNAQLQAQQSIQQLLVQKTQLLGKLQQSEKQVTQAQTELNQLNLRATAGGVVSALNVRKSGEVVQPGQTIAEIAPEGAPLVLAAALPTREAGFVKVGDPVQVKFDAYPYQDFGIFTGKVHSISPDAKPDERLGPIYRVEVVLDRNAVTQKHQKLPLKAGQTATAEIVIRQKRIADILLDPIRKLQAGGINL
ncbi:MAG: HlyD family efflux transporter periplasmic adaptor subunit [Leptolyngbyaceae cyanobacterium]